LGILLTAAASLLVMTGEATAGCTPLGTLFSDDFNRGNAPAPNTLGSNWAVSGQDATIVAFPPDGHLQLGATSDTQVTLTAPGASVADFCLSWDADMLDATIPRAPYNDRRIIYFRSNGTDTYYLFASWNGFGLPPGVIPGRLYRVVSGTLTDLGAFDQAIGAFGHVELCACGTHFTGHTDYLGTSVDSSIDDTDPAAITSAGEITIDNANIGNNAMLVDNVLLQSATSPAPQCSPPQTSVEVDTSAALGLYTGAVTSDAVANMERVVDVDIEPATIVAPLIGATSISLWASIDDIAVSNAAGITVTPNDMDAVGGAFAGVRLVPPGAHSSFAVSFCQPGAATFTLGFNGSAAALTIADILVAGKLEALGSVTPSQIIAFANALQGIPLYAAAMSELSSALSDGASGHAGSAFSDLAAAGRDLGRLAFNRQQFGALGTAFGLLEIHLTASALFRALVGAPYRLIRIISDTIALDVQTGFGSNPIIIRVTAPF
jgi:hypothetical protein